MGETMTRVLIRPEFSHPDMGEGGIRRVVEAQRKWLPEYGIEVVGEAERANANVVIGHATDSPHENPAVPFISCNHGLYWSREQEWDLGYWQINHRCIENLRRAQAITAPSRWVANAIARGMMRKAHVIPHGVELDEWEPAQPQGYVLWNKARTDIVSDQTVLDALAEELPNVQFLTTFGISRPNVKVIGQRVPYPQMKEFVRRAGVYLVTARETFGIGTLEAMAAAVPVVGYDHGGQSEIITNGMDGLLVKPGDVKALAQAVREALGKHEYYGNAGRDTVRRFYQWKPIIESYAEIIRDVAVPRFAPSPRTSIIVTAHNLVQYLPDCLNSVQAQTDPDRECIVVDDDSTDSTRDFVNGFIAAGHPDFRMVSLDHNLGLVGARNAGVADAQGKYLLFLDADDMLAPGAIEQLATVMDKRPDLTVAAGHLDIVTHDNRERRRNPWPFESYTHADQLRHVNQIPYCSLIRREHWLDAGGYRPRNERNEDAEMWCRLGSYGWKIEKVTQEPVIIYRNRGDSKSKQEWAKFGGEPDWPHWFTWKDDDRLTPFGSIGKPPDKMPSWPVHSYTRPQVAVIIPVGPGHESRVMDALDTLLAQTYIHWEAIVVNDTGEPLDLRGFPFVKQVETGRAGSGPGKARNMGVAASTAPLLYFLDADDMLFPDCLRQHVTAWNEAVKRADPTIIYSDWVSVKGPDEFETTKAFDWDCKQIMLGAKQAPTMLISFLHSRRMYDRVGGFDETLGGWEDWDYHIKLVTQAGVCGWRIPTPLLFYRMTTGARRDKSKGMEGRVGQNGSLLNTIYQRYREYYEGKKMCSCNGGGAIARVSNGSKSMNGNTPLTDGDFVLATYQGPAGKQIIVGQQTGTQYGRRAGGDRFYVHKKDVDGTRFVAVTQLVEEPVIVEPVIARAPADETSLVSTRELTPEEYEFPAKAEIDFAKLGIDESELVKSEPVEEKPARPKRKPAARKKKVEA